METGACREHPARKNPLHLALKGDLVNLDERVRIGGFRRRARIAGVGLHAQSAELDGLADVLVEIDDAAGDLVETRKARLLVDDLLRRRLGDHLIARLQCRRRLRNTLLLTLTGSRRIDARWCHRDTLIGLRRCNPDRGLPILRNYGRARWRSERLRLHGSGRGHPLPR